ncbi:MAG: hypothetical protein P0S93_00050 [Candidatus Neptunochlamydia sp.]|nr:hypothetical protein [Candidatus Neptunochlamydia sp.]
MEDEFDRIMEFFNLSAEEKERRLQQVFEDSVEYFERFKYVMMNGTSEEKQEGVKKVMILKRKIEEETKRVCDKTGLTPEQLAAYSNDPKNFSQEQWNAIEEAKKKLDEGVGSLKDATKEKKESGAASKGEGGALKEKKKKPPKNWIQS